MERPRCAADYPELEADGNGAAAADAEDSTGLAAGEDYIVRITEESGEEPVVVACSALAEEDE